VRDYDAGDALTRPSGADCCRREAGRNDEEQQTGCSKRAEI
jgi:hypothetical protein